MPTQLDDLIGQKLVIGFPGTRVTDDVLNQFRDTHAGGVIFYRINFESPEQIKTVISQLEEGLQRKLLVCVDHENGRVVMYRDGVTIFPDNLTFGHAGEIDLARKAGEVAAKELRALGTDINFSPVLDVLTDAYSPNIGIRSFGKSWERVAEMGTAYIQALQAGGVSGTAKHFPGKGHAPVDAHLKLPTIPSTWEDMRKIHLKPFIKAIEIGVDVIMSSHPLYPNLDPDNIATFSRRLITDLLRNELNFKGLISSDDLEMGAVGETCPIGLAAVKAVQAGHDLILSCHDDQSERQVFYSLLEAYKKKDLSVDELEESVERIQGIKNKRKERFEGPIGPHPEGSSLALDISRRGARVLQDTKGKIPLSQAASQQVGIIFPQLSSFAKKIMIEKPYEDETTTLHRLFGNLTGDHSIEIYKIDPSEQDKERATDLAKRAKTTLFFCFDAHLFPGELKLLSALQKATTELVVVLMRDPYDKEFLRKDDVCVTAFGFRHCQIQAAVEKYTGCLCEFSRKLITAR